MAYVVGYLAGGSYPIRLLDNEDGTYSLVTTVEGTDINIGAIEIKDAATDTRAKVAAASAIAEANNLLGIKDPTVGLAADAAIDTDAAGTLSAKLRGLVKILNEQASRVGQETTRPANTTPYTAKDIISADPAAVGVLANVARVNGGSGWITKVRLMTDQKTCTARFRVHFFHTAPAAVADNTLYPLLYANKANRLGYVDLPAMATEDATSSDSANTLATPNTANCNLPLHFVCAGGTRQILYVLETLDAFTPASGQKFYLEIEAELK